MKLFSFLAAALLVAAGLRHVSRRLAGHRRIRPRLLSRVNTQVHRINQRRTPAPADSSPHEPGSAP
ncbi:hypothetical protein GCM10017673_48540 [Streptosporangium violaceochromogenes]|nr:hypothetical protein GCM10017673_48540 [Streptosporangium violaceochromogenes]